MMISPFFYNCKPSQKFHPVSQKCMYNILFSAWRSGPANSDMLILCIRIICTHSALLTTTTTTYPDRVQSSIACKVSISLIMIQPYYTCRMSQKRMSQNSMSQTRMSQFQHFTYYFYHLVNGSTVLLCIENSKKWWAKGDITCSSLTDLKCFRDICI